MGVGGEGCLLVEVGGFLFWGGEDRNSGTVVHYEAIALVAV